MNPSMYINMKVRFNEITSTNIPTRKNEVIEEAPSPEE